MAIQTYAATIAGNTVSPACCNIFVAVHQEILFKDSS